MTIAELNVGPIIPVSDMKRSRKFYEEVLGFPGEPVPGGYALHCGGDTGAYLLDEASYAGKAEWPLASFRTENLELTVAELKSRGVELENIPDGEMKTDERGIAEMDGVSIAWIRDPDRQVLSFFQPTS